MFSQEFYPTPTDVIEMMMNGEKVQDSIVLEPSAGKGNIVDWLKVNGARSVIACENHQDLKKILASKCQVLADDFFAVQSHQVSHVDLIVINPPFSNADKHILHAYAIAPAGCRIIALCNTQTIENPYSKTREQLRQLINEYGSSENLGACFRESERWTEIEVSLIKILKPGSSYEKEFDGFLLEEESEEQANGIISYNVVRDLVNRYVAAVKVFDEQLEAAVKMNELTNSFFNSEIAMSCTKDGQPAQRNEFKKDLQKNAWKYIFEKLNMEKYATRGLKEDINKFVEKQHHIPFTMANVYRMLEIVIGTQESRINRAIMEVFERITQHHDENRYQVEGWKTNSHYLLTKKFIHPYIFNIGWSGQMEVSYHSDRYQLIDDLNKALCFITGSNYDEIGSIWAFNRQNPKAGFNTWYDFGFFRVKGFKKGTGHFEFKDENVWALFNQCVAKLKGYTLYEPKKKTDPKSKNQGSERVNTVKPVILATFKITA